MFCVALQRDLCSSSEAPGSKEHQSLLKGMGSRIQGAPWNQGFRVSCEAASADKAEETKVRIQKIKDKIATYNLSDILIQHG